MEPLVIGAPLLPILVAQRSAELRAEAARSRLAASARRRGPIRLRRPRIKVEITTRLVLYWVVPAAVALTAAASLRLNDPALGDLLWHRVFLNAWPSWCAFPLVQLGYRQLGKFDRKGWWILIASQAFLVVIGIAAGQWGLILIAAGSSGRAYRSWQQFGRPHPGVLRLEGELREARQRIADLERVATADAIVLTGGRPG